MWRTRPPSSVLRRPLAASRGSIPHNRPLKDEGKTVSILVVDGEPVGLVAWRNEPRQDAKRGLEKLSSLGIRTVMLTGDNRRTADAIGSDLGIEFRAELLPQDKQQIVRELQAQGFKVGKVGDGINDAPCSDHHRANDYLADY